MPNLIIEVETTDVIENDQSHVINQVSGFKKNGYTRVLIVPADAVDAAEELVGEINGVVYVRTPSSVAELVYVDCWDGRLISSVSTTTPQFTNYRTLPPPLNQSVNMVFSGELGLFNRLWH